MVETCIFQMFLEDFWQNVLFPDNFITHCKFVSSCEVNSWMLWVYFLLVELWLWGLALKDIFTSHHKLNSVSASDLELCKQTSPGIPFSWAGNSISNQQVFLYSLVAVCRSVGFLLANACGYACSWADQHSQSKSILSNSGFTLSSHANRNCSGKLNNYNNMRRKSNKA